MAADTAASPSDDVLRRIEDGIAWITLNRPDSGNAITADQRNTVIDLLHEIDLDPALVTMVGWLHPVTTLASPALIVPVVAALPGRPHLVASPREVERIFDVALAELADPRIFHEERWRVPGRIIPGSPDNSFAVRFFEVAGEMIWGATARMLSELITIVTTGETGL